MKIFIDLDGTILNVWPRLYFFYERFLHRYNKSCLSFTRFVDLKRKYGKSSIAYEVILKQTKDQNLTSLYLKDWEKMNEDEKYLKQDRFNPEYRPLLRNLGPNLFLLTGRKNRKNLLRQLSKFGIKDLFDKIILDQREKTKPDVLSFKVKILKREADPGDIYIGDTEVDIKAGKMARVITVAVSNGVRSRTILKLEKPDYIISSLIDLPRLIKLVQSNYDHKI